MVVDARVIVQDERVRRALDGLRLGLPLGGDSKPAMEGFGRALKTGAQLRFRTQTAPDGSSWKPSRRASTEGGQTLSLTRRLRNSITYKADRSSVEVGTNVVYAATHQFGATIRAKAGPFLAIPITPEARSAGSPRNMPNLAVAQTLKGQFIMVDSKTGKTHFLLRRQVTIPARPYLGVSDTDATELGRVMSAHLARAWAR